MVEVSGADSPAGDRPQRSSLRRRILVLILLVAFPLSAERMLALLSDRHDLIVGVEDDVRDLARRATLAQMEGLTRARTVLDVVSRQAPDLLKEPAECVRYVTRLADEVAGIQGVYVADPSGQVRCAHLPLAMGVNLFDRAYFQEALAGDDVVMTNLTVSRVSGRNSVFLLRAERGADGRPKTVTGVLVDLQWLSRIAAGSAVESGAVVDVVADGGTVLVRYPAQADIVEHHFPDHPLTRAILAADEGIVTAPGYDGKERIFAFSRFEGLDLRVVVGMETAKVLAPIDRKILATAVAHFVALACFLLLAWVAAEHLVIAPITRLARAVAAVGRGEATRVKDVGVREFTPLVQAFDEMAQRLSQRNSELRTINGRLASLARTDGLTGLANRRTFDVQFSQDWVRARADATPLTLVMLDVDHFKAFNDTFGHVAGDEALRSVARMLSAAAAGTSHLVARYGGEEFIVLMSGARLEAGVAFADDARRLLAELAIAHPGVPRRRLTASLGVASTVPTPEGSPDALVAAADSALYEAKRTGRDRVVTQA
ncbi:GGDEF domain-containing protein [Xanthobacter dioxanivorans]|uniref:diguanylate cyclase n=1 Tax=Xanthobacter dioxanivorans TaxID=2528964 RepID=A0A974SIU1_9HYPH|nr:diguanylate cyclase [Xanthobacter dioxanivorans]QRG07736.1 GGDEF domain-containing protein [Xanthobacter dioxanivorans]